MSSTLNLLSDSTFGTKMDEQNAILEDIKDALGGGSSEDVADLKNMVFPKLVLTGVEGTEFTLTKGTREITGEIDSEGTAEVLVPEIGTWVCDYSLSGQTGSKNIVFSAPMTLVEEEIDFTPVIPATFADATWEQINYATTNDLVPNTWSVGDEKDIELTTGEVLTMQIADKKHDDLTAGGKAGLTLITKNLMAGTRAMNSTNTNAGGFTGSEMYTYLNTTLYNLFPSELKSAIKAVNKKTSAGSQSTTINTDSMKVFLLSEVECFGTTTYSVSGEGSQYPIFTDAASRIKKLSNGSGSASHWWERSPFASNSTGFCGVSGSGSANGTNGASSARGVCFGFCV